MAEIIRIDDLMEKREIGRMNKLEYEARIEFLEGYISARNKMRSADLRLEELEQDYGPSARVLSGMPSGKKSDGSERIIRRMEDIERLEVEHMRSRDEAIKELKRIEAAIDRISPKLQDVLRFKYLNNMDYAQIAKETHYSVRQVHRIHQRGVERIKLPRHQIERIKKRLREDNPEWALIEIKPA